MIRVLLALGLAATGALVASAAGRQEVGGLAALPPWEAAGASLLANGGFESAAGSLPDGWSTRGGGWSLDAGRSGRALKLSGAGSQGGVPGAEQTVRLPPGFYTLEGWVRAESLGANDRRSGVRLCLDARPRAGWWKCTETVRGTRDWTLLRQPLIAVTEAGAYRVTAGAYGAPDGAAWFDDVGLVPVGRPPLDVFLLYPNFRGLLFDDRPQTVRVALAVEAEGARRDGAHVRLSLADEAGGTVRARREYPAAPRLTGELDASGLGPGAYRLRAELVDRAGEVIDRHPGYRIVKAPARAREGFNVWYDEHNTTYLRGRPAFVIGLYTTGGYSTSPAAYARGHDGWGTARMTEAGVNMLVNYWLGIAPVPALEALLDDLRSRGIHYLQTVNFYHSGHPQYRTIPYPAARQGEDALNRWVAGTLSRHPALAGFYTADERPADVVPAVFRQYRALAAAAPGTVTYGVLGDGWEQQAPLWRDALDVIGLDPYPITRPPGENHLAMVGEWARLGREAVQGARPLWMVIQYFPLTGAGGWPRYEDLRAMSWMAIIEGARGLFYWSYGAKGLAWEKDPARREQHWGDLVRVTREIRALEAVLLAPDAPVARSESSGGAVRWLGKRLGDGTRYLFAYNTRRTPARVVWTLAEPAREVVDLDGVGPVSLAGAELRAELGPYQVRRFRVK